MLLFWLSAALVWPSCRSRERGPTRLGRAASSTL